MHNRILEPAAEQFILAALTYLDDVPAADPAYWKTVLEALQSVQRGLAEEDPQSAYAAMQRLELALSTRAIPIGSRPVEPMPETVRDIRVALQHRLGSSADAGKAGHATSPHHESDHRRPKRSRA